MTSAKPLPIVALIGQTNAGKSSLLNRFARKNIAIVAREEGTTRDNVIARIDDRFLLVDTAGLKNPDDAFEAQIQDQINDAIDTAELILLTLDSSKYPSQKDRDIARTALKSKKPVFLLLNKSDLGDSLPDHEFLKLGIKPAQTFRVSATTGQGISTLKTAILEELGSKAGALANEGDSEVKFGALATKGESEVVFGALASSRARSDENARDDGPFEERATNATSETPLRIALIGRPNVGKSSLFNTLGKKQQAIVSSKQGTTRDVNRLQVRYKGRDIEILDTAGLRRPGKREVGIEKFSALRSLAAIEESDLSALLVDVTDPHAKLDQSLAGQIVKSGKSIIVILTKCDLVTSEKIDEVLDDLERDYNFLPFAPVLKTSSATGENVTKLFELAIEILQNRQQKIPTNELNKILNEAILEHAPAGLKNTRPKPKYIVQTDSNPPWFVVHGHNLELLHWSWKRFLERKIREKYPFVGTPIFFSFKSDD